MKRSSAITLVLLTSAAMSLSGCDEPPQAVADPGGTFSNKAECVAVYDTKTCDAAEKLAQAEHEKNAPKSTREKCIEDYGADMCKPSSDGSGMFMPLMVGYMMGSAMSSPAPLYYGPGSYRDRERYGSGYSAPIYSSSPQYRSQGPIGNAPYRATAGTTTSKGSLKSTTSLTPVQRGGFGTSFKPTSSFKSSYVTSNPGAFKSSFSASSKSSYATSARASSSGVSRGGFGGSARGFSAGG